VERVLSAGLRALFSLPTPVLRRLAGPERRNDRGDVFEVHTQLMLRLSELLRFPKAHELTPGQARAHLERETRIVDPSGPDVLEVEHRVIHGPAGGIPVVVYVPRETPDPLPVLVYYHGGGYCLGSLPAYDGICRALARGGDCVVVSVDYRLAPEHPFPAAIEDAVAAFERVASVADTIGGDPDRVAVGGDSAGGALAAVVCHLTREAERRPALQFLVYPATDLTRSCASHDVFAEGYYLETQTKEWFNDHYLSGGAEATDPRVSPLLAERFDDLPPAIVVTAGFDPLRDEGEAYAEALREAGVAVDEIRESTLPHGFLNMAVIEAAAEAREEIGALLRQRLHGPLARGAS
jgi:acetyl esterase